MNIQYPEYNEMGKLKDVSGYDSWRYFVLNRQGEQNESWRAEVNAMLHVRATGWHIKSITSAEESGAEAIISRDGVTALLEAAMITQLPGSLPEIDKIASQLKQCTKKYLTNQDAILLISDFLNVSTSDVSAAVKLMRDERSNIVSEKFELLHGDKVALNQLANTCGKDFVFVAKTGTVIGSISEEKRFLNKITNTFHSKRSQHRAKNSPIYLYLYAATMPTTFDVLNEQRNFISNEAAKRHFPWVVIQHDGSKRLFQMQSIVDGILDESKMQLPP